MEGLECLLNVGWQGECFLRKDSGSFAQGAFINCPKGGPTGGFRQEVGFRTTIPRARPGWRASRR